MAQVIEYGPWGKISREEGVGDSVRRFTGKRLDPESGLLYYGGRYYDPELGRFISADPFVSRLEDPQGLNRYSYVRNNPINYVDPSGFFFKKLFKSIGKFFKRVGQSLQGLFRKPGVFFATLAVGLVAGAFIGPAVGGLFFQPGTWGVTATAWAVGGAAAGVTSAAMTGGNVWQGALLGGVGGAIGGGVAGYLEGGIAGNLSGAVAGGAAAGGLRTTFRGGNFFENTWLGATTAGILASGQALAMQLWEAARAWRDTWKLRSGDEVHYDKTGKTINTVGQTGKSQSLIDKIFPPTREGDFNIDTPWGKFFNQVSKVHDWGNSWGYSNGRYVSGGVAFDTAVDVFWNYPTMPVAGAYTAFAFHGQHSYVGIFRDRD